MSEYPLTEKLQELKKKYEALSEQLSGSDVMSDMKKYIQLNREYKELEPIVAAGDKYVRMVSDLEGAKEILSKEKDEDLRELAKEEVSSIEGQLPGMEEEIKLLLIPKDPQDWRSAAVQEGTRRQSSPGTFSACMPSTASARDGSSRSTASPRALPADTRR